MMTLVSVWKELVDSLDTPGGHILVLVGLLLIGWRMGSTELTVASMGALFALLRTTQSNHARTNGTGGSS